MERGRLSRQRDGPTRRNVGILFPLPDSYLQLYEVFVAMATHLEWMKRVLEGKRCFRLSGLATVGLDAAGRMRTPRGCVHDSWAMVLVHGAGAWWCNPYRVAAVADLGTGGVARIAAQARSTPGCEVDRLQRSFGDGGGWKWWWMSGGRVSVSGFENLRFETAMGDMGMMRWDAGVGESNAGAAQPFVQTDASARGA